MKDPSFYVGSLLDLPKLTELADRRAAWRQSMTALARAPEDDGVGPLEGLHPEALLLGVKVALAQGFADDLDWLSPAAAGSALYELASAVPFGQEKRELGRRALSRLLDGDAEAFVAIATRMVRASGRGLGSPGMRARVALIVELPIGLGIDSGPLALALASRRDTAREWLDIPSTGSLPARRLAARLLERAAREATRRASQGDEHPLRAFKGDAVHRAYARLLADRESLVWRHVAVARGLLVPWMKELKAEIDAGLDPKLSPTEWRRAATSIAAMVAVDAPSGLRHVDHAMANGVLERDPGVGPALIWGVPRAAEAEPEAAMLLIEKVLGRVPAQSAEAVIELGAELGQSPVVDRASTLVLKAMGDAGLGGSDDGEAALTREILRDLDRAPRDDDPLRQGLARALEIYATEGARSAYKAGTALIGVAKGVVDALAAVSDDEDDASSRAASMARRTSVAVLRDLDISLLERHVLSDLLVLGSNADQVRANVEALDQLRERMAEWILAREGAALVLSPTPEGPRVSQPIVRLQRLRALLHLLDSDVGDAQEDGARAALLRDRWRRIAKALILRFEQDPTSPLRRTTVAALARAADALVRGGACGPEDVLLVAARERTTPGDFETLSEASMDPDLVHVLGRYALFLRASAPVTPAAAAPPGARPAKGALAPDAERGLAALEELAREVIPDGSGRREALRTVLMRVAAALRAIASASALRNLASASGNEAEAVEVLEAALASLSQLCAGARTRLEPLSTDEGPPPSTIGERPLSVAVARVLSATDEALDEDLLTTWLVVMRQRVPRGVADVVASSVRHLASIPLDRPSKESIMVAVPEPKLPPWLPPHRTLGGFYVMKQLGAGAVGSVFVVLRLEDRYDHAAERFALKVPDYSATAARSISEAEFMQLFKDEASALMAVPAHRSLARFVTFDLAARPKPILVMELVEGTLLERMIESGTFDMPRALKVLDDVLSGLEAMHEVGVGHLDLKPSNVILRRDDEAVLVDFGLAGRKIRPGCATGPYGAPEVWGVESPGSRPTPMLVDVYAFGCLAFETLTGRILFDAASETELIARHISHDGLPQPLKDLGQQREAAPLIEVLFATLRRDPANRPTVSRLRQDLKRLAPDLSRLRWPLGATS